MAKYNRISLTSLMVHKVQEKALQKREICLVPLLIGSLVRRPGFLIPALSIGFINHSLVADKLERGS